MHPRRIEEVGTVDLDDELVVYNSLTHEVHILDPVSAFLWEACDGATPVAALADLLVEASPATPPETARAIVEQTLARLAAILLLDGSSPAGADEASALATPGES